MRRNEVLDSKKEKIIEMYRSGMKQEDIAKSFSVSQTSISIRLRKWGVSNPDGNRFIRNNIDKDALYDMYWNQKMHPVDIAKKYGCTKMVIHNRMKEFGIPTRTKSEARMGELNPIYGVGHSQTAKEKMSDAFANGRRIGFGQGTWGKGSYYITPNQGMKWFRSGWERKTAEYLTNEGRNWYYEYKWLKLSNGMNYLPDFYLPDDGIYIEVKGRKKDKDMEKFEFARNEYSVELWDGIELLKRGIIDNCGDATLNRKYRKKKV